MNNFDSQKINEFQGIWVFCEQQQGVLHSVNFELVSEARRLADDLNTTVTCLLLGNELSDDPKILGGYGADFVYLYQDPSLEYYVTEAYAKVVCDAVMKEKPEVLLFGATSLGRDLAPRCAARLRTGLTADCTHLDVSMSQYLTYLSQASGMEPCEANFDQKDKNIKMTRPAFGSHLMATIICPNFRPSMATVRPGVVKCQEYDSAKEAACVLKKFPVDMSEEKIMTVVLEVAENIKKAVDLSKAEVIVAVGRGIGKDASRGLELAQQLADGLGGVVAGSRAAIDYGWLEHDRQIGQTGTCVHPRIYIALGISGAMQHLVGMQDADCIIAINKNPEAPIYRIADYGLCGDLFSVVPMLIEAVKNESISD